MWERAKTGFGELLGTKKSESDSPPQTPSPKSDEKKEVIIESYFFTEKATAELLKGYSGVTDSEQNPDAPVFACTPDEFEVDFNRRLFSFSILQDGEKQKVTISSENPGELIQGLTLFFGSESKAKQIQKLAQGVFAPMFSNWLKFFSEKEQGKVVQETVSHFEFIKISEDEDRFIVRLTNQNKMNIQGQMQTVCSFDEIYELGFTEGSEVGPDFFLVQGALPMLSVHDSSIIDEKRGIAFVDMELPVTQYTPEDRLENVLKMTSEPRPEFKYDFANPIFNRGTGIDKTKSELKEEKVGAYTYNRLWDTATINPAMTDAIMPFFDRISDECVLEVTDFAKAEKHVADSIFDEKGNLQSWIGDLSEQSVSLEEKADFTHYIRTIYTAAREGILTEDGTFHGWLNEYFGKPLLTQVKEKVGNDLFSGYCITAASLRLATALSENVPVVDAQKMAKKMSVAFALLNHQNKVILAAVHEHEQLAAKLKELQADAKEPNIFKTPGFTAWMQKIDKARKDIPFGNFWKATPLMKSLIKLAEIPLERDSIDTFYVLGNLNDQKENLNVDQVIEVVKNKKLNEMFVYAREKFKLLPKYPVVERIQDLISRGDEKKTTGRVQTNIPNMQLVYQLANDGKKTEFATEILNWLGEESSNSAYTEIDKVFDQAVGVYQEYLQKKPVNIDIYTPLLKLINQAKKEDDPERYVEVLQGIITEFNVINQNLDRLNDQHIQFHERIAALNTVFDTAASAEVKEGDAKYKQGDHYAAFMNAMIKDDIEKIKAAQEYKKIATYHTGWTLWFLRGFTLWLSSTIKNKQNERDEFFNLLNSDKLNDKIVFFKTVKNVVDYNKSEKKEEKKEAEGKLTVDQRAENLAKQLTRIRNPLARLFYHSTAKSTTEDEIVDFYNKNKDNIDRVLNKVEKK